MEKVQYRFGHIVDLKAGDRMVSYMKEGHWQDVNVTIRQKGWTADPDGKPRQVIQLDTVNQAEDREIFFLPARAVTKFFRRTKEQP